MKTYISLFDKKATEANNKKEASKNLGVPEYKVIISDVHISMLKDYSVVQLKKIKNKYYEYRFIWK